MSSDQSENQAGDLSLCEEFFMIVSPGFSKYPGLNYSLKVNTEKTDCILIFPRQNEQGFDVSVAVSPITIVVSARGAHEHFDFPKGKERSKIEAPVSLARNLLSSDMRIREFCAGKSAYRWDMEALYDDAWQNVNSTGLLLWNFFGKRRERIFQNDILPGRLNSSQ